MSIPYSVIHQKHYVIKYHSVSEAVAEYILQIGKDYRATNLADLLTKVVSGQKLWDLCYHIFH